MPLPLLAGPEDSAVEGWVLLDWWLWKLLYGPVFLTQAPAATTVTAFTGVQHHSTHLTSILQNLCIAAKHWTAKTYLFVNACFFSLHIAIDLQHTINKLKYWQCKHLQIAKPSLSRKLDKIAWCMYVYKACLRIYKTTDNREMHPLTPG